MKLYIANVSRQHLTHAYRVPGEVGIKQVQIPPGQQRMIYSPNLSQEQVDGIVEQSRKYGMVSIDEVDRARSQVTMCYSVNREVSFAKIQKLLVSNHNALLKEGEKTRKEAAVVAHHLVENPAPDLQFSKTTDVEIVEQPVNRGEIEIDDHMTVPSARRNEAAPPRRSRGR